MVIDETPLRFQDSAAGSPLPEFKPEDFFRLMLEFVGKYTDAEIQAQIDAARSTFSRSVWGQYYHAGIANLVAHRLTWIEYIKKYGLTGRLLDDKTSKTVGSVSVGRDAYLLAAKMKDPLLVTAYGAEYRRLQRLVAAGARAV